MRKVCCIYRVPGPNSCRSYWGKAGPIFFDGLKIFGMFFFPHSANLAHRENILYRCNVFLFLIGICISPDCSFNVSNCVAITLQ